LICARTGEFTRELKLCFQEFMGELRVGRKTELGSKLEIPKVCIALSNAQDIAHQV
jgi:hypothetical protein